MSFIVSIPDKIRISFHTYSNEIGFYDSMPIVCFFHYPLSFDININLNIYKYILLMS